MQGPDNFLQALLALLLIVVGAGLILAVAQFIRKRIHRKLGLTPEQSSEEE